MEYKKPKQKPTIGLNKTAVDTQEFATLKTKKFGEPEPVQAKTKKHFKLPKLHLKKFKIISPKKIPKKSVLLVKKSKTQLRKLSKKQIIAISAVAVVILAGGGMLNFSGNKPTKKPEVKGKATLKLSFTPIVAPGKAIYVDPEGKRDTGSYPDTIGNINIRVSEQALPNDFKPDTETRLASFAKTNYYNQQLTAGDTKVYAGMSIKGVQSIVFSKNNLLIFIKAERKLEDKALVDYINSLR